MGMSAAQARLLSITARITDNELRSQMITNSKLRLADQSSAASQEYMNALNTVQLVYTSYDDAGNKITQTLNANTLLTYADLKNQYAMVNTSGQILVSASDITNYETSANMAEFMYAYGIEKTDNPEYPEALKEIFGDNYDKFMTNLSGEPDEYIYSTYVNNLSQNYSNWVENIDTSNSTNYNNWVASGNGEQGFITSYLSNLSQIGDVDGLLNSYVNVISNPPEWNIEDPPELAYFQNLVASYNSAQCHNSVAATEDGIGHMEHNLAALIWGLGGLGTNEDTVITNSDGTITVDKTGVAEDLDYGYVSLTNYHFSDTESSENLLEALNSSDRDEVQTVKEKIINLYCDVINYLDQNSVGTSSTELNSGRYSITSSAQVKSEEELLNEWNAMYASINDLSSALYQESYDEWYLTYLDFLEEIETWKSSCKNVKKVLDDAINSIPSQEIPDENDSKYQWYKNLWYRMGGMDDSHKDENNKNYKELDSTLLNSSEWLQFALENGIITLEQATFSTNGSATYPNMGTYDWNSIIYTNSVDIVSQEDSAAIAKAEVKYENALREIQNEDNKLDQDLKKLDTEHTALETEYESVKSVIEKNVERSFKAFS